MRTRGGGCLGFLIFLIIGGIESIANAIVELLSNKSYEVILRVNIVLIFIFIIEVIACCSIVNILNGF